MKKKEVKIVQKEANKRIMYIVIVLGILFLALIYLVFKFQVEPVMENGCSALGEGYEEAIIEKTSELTGKTIIEYRCCSKENSTCITISAPKEE